MKSPSPPIRAALAIALLPAAGCGADEKEVASVPPPAVTATATTTAVTEPETPSARCTRIVVDPGHDAMANLDTEPIGPGSSKRKIKDGGGTSGVSSRTPEHQVTLQISLKLRDELRRRGYCVTMTRARSEGRSMGNIARARIANEAKAALFVRVHADGSTDHGRNGTFVLYPASHPGWTDDILPESKTAAKLVQRELLRSLGSRDLGIVPRSDLTGFNWADVPAILPEIGYLTNPREDKLLNSASYQRKAALGMANGIEAFVKPAGG